ncbi:hypothetical protein LTR85_006898 [Meristemomyces frigidus]|nr:hypothetical protein LTR85_006898 [Meristemomyces frigidus]
MASAAGLLSLAGQCITGAQALREIHQDMSSASKTVDAFLKDIDAMIKTLHAVEDLLKVVETRYVPYVSPGSDLATLSACLEDCKRGVHMWLATARQFRPATGKGATSLFRKFWTAANQRSVKTVRADIQQCRQNLTLALSTLGRMFDVQAAVQTDRIEGQLQQGTALTEALLESSALQQSTLERLEILSQSIESVSIGSMRSLATMCSSMSRSAPAATTPSGHFTPQFPASPQSFGHDRRASSSSQPGGWPRVRALHEGPTALNTDSDFADNNITPQEGLWTCGHPSKWEALFNRSEGLVDGTAAVRCSLCDEVFAEPPNTDVRWHHLDYTHHLGQCKLAKTFKRSDQFWQHLKHSHNASTGDWRLLDMFCYTTAGMDEPQYSSHPNCLELDARARGAAHNDGTLQYRTLRGPLSLPSNHLGCFFCDQIFDGRQAWRERLIHVGKHMEVANQTGDALVDLQDWEIDQATETYMASLGLIIQHGEHWVGFDVLQDIKRRAGELGDITVRKRQRLQEDEGAAEAGTKHRVRPEHESPSEPPGFGPFSLLVGSWDAELLGVWNGKKDRINRWMLHSLGSDAEQANVYREIVQGHAGLTSPGQPLEQVTINARDVMKHWFTDEAAVGTNMAAAPSIARSGSLLPPSLMSSRPGLSSRLS